MASGSGQYKSINKFRSGQNSQNAGAPSKAAQRAAFEKAIKAFARNSAPAPF